MAWLENVQIIRILCDCTQMSASNFFSILTSWAYSERENKLSEISKLKNLLRDLILIKSDGENFKWEVNLNKNLLST